MIQDGRPFGRWFRHVLDGASHRRGDASLLRSHSTPTMAGRSSSSARVRCCTTCGTTDWHRVERTLADVPSGSVGPDRAGLAGRALITVRRVHTFVTAPSRHLHVRAIDPRDVLYPHAPVRLHRVCVGASGHAWCHTRIIQSRGAAVGVRHRRRRVALYLLGAAAGAATPATAHGIQRSANSQPPEVNRHETAGPITSHRTWLLDRSHAAHEPLR